MYGAPSPENKSPLSTVAKLGVRMISCDAVESLVYENKVCLNFNYGVTMRVAMP